MCLTDEGGAAELGSTASSRSLRSSTVHGAWGEAAYGFCAGADLDGHVDGLGRMRATLATGDEDNAWVRSGITTLDKKGTVRRTYQSDFYDLSDTAYSCLASRNLEHARA